MLTFERPAVSRSSGCLMPVSVSSTGDADRPQSLHSCRMSNLSEAFQSVYRSPNAA